MYKGVRSIHRSIDFERWGYASTINWVRQLQIRDCCISQAVAMGNTGREDSCLLYFLDGIYVDSMLFGVYSLRNEENTTSDFCRVLWSTTVRHLKDFFILEGTRIRDVLYLRIHCPLFEGKHVLFHTRPGVFVTGSLAYSRQCLLFHKSPFNNFQAGKFCCT